MVEEAKKEITGFRLVFGYLGLFLVFVGVITLLPLVIIAFYPSETQAILPFAITGGVDVAIGLLLYFLLIHHRKRKRFVRYEEAMLLTLTWLFAILSGAFPFYLIRLFYPGELGMGFSTAFFESASAYTSTGLTAFASYLDVDSAFCPHVYCFHRSLMQFIGGCGLILLLSSILGGQNGTALYVSEGHSDKLLPNLARSARLIFGIYSMYTLIGALALFFAGMDPFDALNHAMCALAGGGMSTRSMNIASFRASGIDGTSSLNGIFPVSSIAIELIIDVLVILSAVSFVLHVFLLTGKWNKFFADDETKTMIAMGVVGIIIGFFATLIYNYQQGSQFFANSGSALRNSSFYVIGSMTTSGFANTDIATLRSLGEPLIFICILLMLIGGGMGSTAGGIKMYRVVIMMHQVVFGLVHRFDPEHKRSPFLTYRYGKVKDISREQVIEAFSYTALFLFIFFAAVIILCFLPEIGVENACFNVASAISNVGTAMDDFVRYQTIYPAEWLVMSWTLSITMILGRLEIIPMLNAGRNIFEEIRYGRKQRESRRRSFVIPEE